MLSILCTTIICVVPTVYWCVYMKLCLHGLVYLGWIMDCVPFLIFLLYLYMYLLCDNKRFWTLNFEFLVDDKDKLITMVVHDLVTQAAIVLTRNILVSVLEVLIFCSLFSHDDVIKWKHFPRNWPFVRGIHRSRWIPHTKASDAELWCFLWFASE